MDGQVRLEGVDWGEGLDGMELRGNGLGRGVGLD